jgi:DNA polymerase III delta subunit
LPSLILINGQEEFLKEEKAFYEAKASLCDSIEIYRGGDTSSYEDYISMDRLDGSTTAHIFIGFKEVPPLPSSEDLVIVTSKGSDLENPRSNKVFNFPKLKTYGKNNEVVSWIKNRGESLGLDLSLFANALFMSNGHNLRKIDSEIKKLFLISESETLTPDIFKSVVSYTNNLTPKEIVDSIISGNAKRAIIFYDKLQDQGEETGWIIAFIQRMLIQQIKLEILCSSDLDDFQMSEKLGISTYAFRHLKTRQGSWELGLLKTVFEDLCSIDLLHKSGNQSSKPLLEQIIIKLSEAKK